jgi:hypothetical protein
MSDYGTHDTIPANGEVTGCFCNYMIGAPTIIMVPLAIQLNR